MNRGTQESGCPFHRLFGSKNTTSADGALQNRNSQGAEAAASQDRMPSGLPAKQKLNLENMKAEVKR